MTKRILQAVGFGLAFLIGWHAFDFFKAHRDEAVAVCAARQMIAIESGGHFYCADPTPLELHP